MKWVVAFLGECIGFGGFEVELGGERHVFVNMQEREREIFDRLVVWWCYSTERKKGDIRMCEVKT